MRGLAPAGGGPGASGTEQPGRAADGVDPALDAVPAGSVAAEAHGRGGEVAAGTTGAVGGAIVGAAAGGPAGAVVGAIVGAAGGRVVGRDADGMQRGDERAAAEASATPPAGVDQAARDARA